MINAPGVDVIKLFTTEIYEFLKKAIAFCPWPAFQAYSNKHSRLLRKIVNYGRKKFYNIDTRGQCYKTFSVRDLRIFILSQSVCQTKLKRLTNEKHSSLLRKFVNYRHKKLRLCSANRAETVPPMLYRVHSTIRVFIQLDFVKILVLNKTEFHVKSIEIRLECRCLQKYFLI